MREQKKRAGKIKLLASKKGWTTQAQIAAAVGMSAANISRAISGSNLTAQEKLMSKMCALTGVPLAFFEDDELGEPYLNSLLFRQVSKVSEPTIAAAARRIFRVREELELDEVDFARQIGVTVTVLERAESGTSLKALRQVVQAVVDELGYEAQEFGELGGDEEARTEERLQKIEQKLEQILFILQQK